MPRRRQPRTRPRGGHVCQSCGMPFEWNEAAYCSHCYRAGRFVLPDLTVEQMQARVTARLRDVGVPARRASTLTARIPRLTRWKRRS